MCAPAGMSHLPGFSWTGMIYAAEHDSLLVLEVFHHVLHVAELGVQAAPLSHQAVELPPEVVDVGFKNGVQGLPGNSVTLLLEEGPLGLQHLVLLLQKAHLGRNKTRDMCEQHKKPHNCQEKVGSPTKRSRDVGTIRGELLGVSQFRALDSQKY